MRSMQEGRRQALGSYCLASNALNSKHVRARLRIVERRASAAVASTTRPATVGPLEDPRVERKPTRVEALEAGVEIEPPCPAIAPKQASWSPSARADSQAEARYFARLASIAGGAVGVGAAKLHTGGPGKPSVGAIARRFARSRRDSPGASPQCQATHFVRRAAGSIRA
jgi:hypothetical protein